MTKPRYRQGCPAGSQASERTVAASPADYAWIVNFNNGNSNWNNRDNDNYVRAVRPGECHDAVQLRDLHAAWLRARQGKKPSPEQFAFDADWIDGLLDLQKRLVSGTWSPAPPTCFIATAPKAREIHAPAFADRIVHHWLVSQLEQIYEPVFIHDSFSNRAGKGTHSAVGRLRSFVRQVHSGQGDGYYLQLDVRNFFNRIHRPTLYALLKRRMARADLSEPARRATHALLRHPAGHAGVRYACAASERALVPAHKRLENAPPGCGIAIGNLSSQFFANVYLNELDQFVKHELRAARYLRYVDDFVLVHESREQLEAWHAAIVAFLRNRLRLELKPGAAPRPLTAGIDFLGYVTFPRHLVVRRRVIGHARARLAAWERAHLRHGRLTRDIDAIAAVRSVWASYHAPFRHAHSYQLRARLRQRFPWLEQIA